MALAILVCLLFLIAVPYVIDPRNKDLALTGAAVFAASRDSYALSAPVRLIKTPMIELESGTLSMPNSRSGIGRGGEVLAALITGKSARLALDDATFTADFSAGEAGFAQGASVESLAPLVTALQRLQFDALSVRNSSVRMKMADGSVIRLDDLFADVSAKPDGTVRTTGSFVFRGEKVDFDTTLGAASEQLAGERPLTASFQSRVLNAKLGGTLLVADAPRLIAPQAELTIPNLRRAARWLGANLQSGAGFENFYAKGQLEWVNRTLAFQKAAVQMDGNEASGTFSINFAGARPALDGTLGLKTLDLTKYFGSRDKPSAAREDGSLLSLVRDAEGLEFPLIQAVDADLRISSDSVVIPGMTVGRSAATISLRGGKMIADLAEFEIDEATRGGGQLRIDATAARPTYDIRGKLEALDLGPAAQAVFGHPTVQGRGAVTIELTASGNDGTQLLRSLDGKLCVTLNEGGLLGLDVNKLVAEANSDEPAGVWRAASTGAITIDKLDAKFALANGTIRTETAEALSGSRAMKARGAIDLPTRSLDLELAIGDRQLPDPVTEAVPGAKPNPAVAPKPPERREVLDMRGPWAQPIVRSSVTGQAAPAAPLPNPG
jgi:AsmA protein